MLTVIAAACLPDSPSSPSRPQEVLSTGATRAAQLAPPTATAFVIEFVVSGTTADDDHLVDISWRSGDGPDESETNVNVAAGVWSRFVTVVPGSRITLDASNTAAGDARPVRCEIYLSGQLWASDETSNPTGAACSAVAGW